MPEATVALLQSDPGTDAAANLERALGMVAVAARAGADGVCLTGALHCRGRHDTMLAAATRVAAPVSEAPADAARARGVRLFGGSCYEPSPDPGKAAIPRSPITLTATWRPPTASRNCSTWIWVCAGGFRGPRGYYPATTS